MPTNLGFNATRDGRTIPDAKKGFRDFLISRTLKSPEGPQTFTESFYQYNNQSDYPNVDPGTVVNYTTNIGQRTREDDLTGHKRTNTFKPEEYFIIEDLNSYTRKANLNLYPYFTQTNHTLIGIMSNDNYTNESELMKFAAYNIKTNRQGPIFSRIEQNLKTATIGRARLIDAIEGNIATATNILTGKEPLIELNNKITVAASTVGKGVDFLQTVSGIESPFSEIPGDYLTNPLNPIDNRPEPKTEAGKIFQDVTGVLGSLIGIKRRPKLSRKPSDLFIEYMGQGQKQTLFDLLSYSTYAPNYTSTARSQQSSKTFNLVNQFAQGVKDILGLEAPAGRAYIGDDRGNDVKFAMGDFNDRPVRSPFYLSLMFDPVQTVLFQRTKNIQEGGQLGSQLTWISKNSKNKLGTNNQNYADQSGKIDDSLSNNFDFRTDSILSYTQDILDTMPTDGGEARSHISNVIDQTSRIFREGDVYLSRGSAVQYVDKFGNQTGVEFCRTWTKDRPYFTYADTMKKGMNVRLFEGSVMSNPWNLNIAPMSKNKEFTSSTNIGTDYEYGPDKDGNNFYAKKYMFSIENLAWKTSNTPGFTVLDLPYCERGPNGGRIMWFPPYELKINESNAARWEENTFLGRPEPIYTYQNTSRNGQISFKVVVDHPSILNLLVRERFKDMSDEEADNYINAFFAGCETIDFYELIRTYTTLSQNDADLILQYLNAGKKSDDTESVKKLKKVLQPPTTENPGSETVVTPEDTPQQTTEGKTKEETVKFETRLNFDDNYPKPTTGTESSDTYDQLYEKYITVRTDYVNKLAQWTDDLVSYQNEDTARLIGTKKTTEPVSAVTANQVTKLESQFDQLETRYLDYKTKTELLKLDISGKTAQNIKLKIKSSTSALTTDVYNRSLSLRRSHSVIKDFFTKISKDGTMPAIPWLTNDEIRGKAINESIDTEHTFTLKDFGWGEDYTEKVTVTTSNVGEFDTNCINMEFKSLPIMSVVAPIAFYCRASDVSVEYNVVSKVPVTPPPPTVQPPDVPQVQIVPFQETPVPKEVIKKPPIDVMKRIIMKTLSECYYFQLLEENSPVQFNSLKEKLKYFHPAFHSTTPEGLNSRLTFLHQCIRPGETIPIKGISDTQDLTARNTTFGPPPICVLRIGDFYHSKIVIRDININYDDGGWDFNPEGIGVQPMIANVSLQVSFLGGHGLEKPVERLQNALSSNFYANTEMYDERSESSLTEKSKIGGKSAEVFTRKFLDQLNESYQKDVVQTGIINNKITEGQYIGTLDKNLTDLNLAPLVENLIKTTDSYFNAFKLSYNGINVAYGPIITSCLFSPTYRPTKTYDIYESATPTSTTIDLFGLPKKGREIEVLISNFKNSFIKTLTSTNISTIFGFDKELTSEKLIKSEEILKPLIIELVNDNFLRLDVSININLKNTLEENRNTLINDLDKLNYLVKFGYDAKVIENSKTKKGILSGFTGSDFYGEYNNYIDYIKNNTPKMYETIDNTFDFYNPIVTSNHISSVLSVWIKNPDIIKILKLYTDDPSGLFTPKIIKDLEKRLNNFIVKIEEKNFKFSKVKPRKNGKPINYKFTEGNLTDNTASQEIKLLNSSAVPVTNNKLNYYKIPKK